MDLTRFQQTVTRLERLAQASPRGYTLRVGALAAVGYGYVVLLLAVIAGGFLLVGAGILAGKTNVALLKFELALGFLGFMVLRALWVRVPPPEGLEVTRASAPGLADTIEEVRQLLDAPGFHHTLLTDDLNAAVVQVPRLGILGWQRNYLCVGLPLLEALTLEQFRAVLAHEFGHLSGNHARFGSWIYRVRQTWARLLAQLEASENLLGRMVVTPFLKWYTPYFNAYSFVLARKHEYEADRRAAELHGREVIAAALVRIEVVARFHGKKYLPAIHGRARTERVPTAGPVSEFRTSLRGLEADEARRWFGSARLRLTDIADTHPALSDRLAALEVAPESLDPDPAPGDTAADALLGPARAGFAATLDQRWREAVAMPWQLHHEELQAGERRLAELEAQAGDGALPLARQWERVQLLARLQEETRAIAQARALLQDHPAHAPTHFYLGSALLEQGAEEGVLHLKAAMASDPEARLPAAGMLFEHHWNRGERALAEPYRLMIERRSRAVEEATEERQKMGRPILLSPATYAADDRAALTAALRQRPEIREAYLARREVHLLPEEPCHLIGLRLRRPWWKWSSDQADAALLQTVIREVPTPRETYWVLLEGRHRWLRSRFRAVPGGDLLSPMLPPPAPPAQSPAERQREVEQRFAGYRRRRRLAWAGGLGLVVIAFGYLLLWSAEDLTRQYETPVLLQRMPVEQAAWRIVNAGVRPRLVVIYRTSNDRSVLTPLLHYGFDSEERGLTLLAFGIDLSEGNLHDYWVEAGLQDRPQLALERWPSGGLVAALDASGITLPMSFSTPFIALLDASGNQVKTWQRPASIAEIRQLADSLLVP